MDLKTEIMRRVESLPQEEQRQLLAYFDNFEYGEVRGEKGAALLAFAGTLDAASAAEMSSAIESGCEAIDVPEW